MRSAALSGDSTMKRKLNYILAAGILLLAALVLATGIKYLLKPVVPPFDGNFVVELNDNIPEFAVKDITPSAYVLYSELDSRGRAGAANGCLDATLIPTETRGSISQFEPSGWNSSAGIYNRSHLIAYQLTGNDIAQNLITGTVYLNVNGMLPYENRVAMYIKNTGNHVLYRVTPLYNRNDLVARAVQMEAYSVEDFGHGVSFNVLIYNIQPGYRINYATGQAWGEETTAIQTPEPEIVSLEITDTSEDMPEFRAILPGEGEELLTYVLNTKTKRFHYPYCNGVLDMKDENREDFYGTRDEAIERGYKPCGTCNP